MVALGGVPVTIVSTAAATAADFHRDVPWHGCVREGGNGACFKDVRQGHHLAAVRKVLAAGGAAVSGVSALHARDAHLLLMLQYFPDIGRMVVDVQGGGRQAGETSLQCALRELEEEAGVGASTATLEVVASIDCDAAAVAAAAVAGVGTPDAAATVTSEPVHRVVHVVRLLGLKIETDL